MKKAKIDIGLLIKINIVKSHKKSYNGSKIGRVIVMIVRLIKKTKIYNFTLPQKVTGNYWITDNDYFGNIRNLINVEATDGEWKIKSDFETRIMAGEKELESAILKDYSIYFLKINTENEYVILYCSPTIDYNVSRLEIMGNCEITIGNNPEANIIYNFPLVSRQHAKLTYNNKKWYIEDTNSKYGTYVNNFSITSRQLEYGDIIFIVGLKIIVLENTIIVNKIGNLITFDNRYFRIKQPIIQKQTEFDNPDEENIEFYKEDDYFYRAPRFKTKIEPISMEIDSPPGKQAEDKTPLIYTVGPMLAMAMTSVFSAYNSISGVIDGSKDLSAALPSIIMAVAMLGTMLLWPLLTKAYQSRQKKKQEAERQKKYMEYITSKRQKIQAEMKIQRQILIDNYLPLEETKDIIISKKRNLWEREIDQSDFLDLRLGIGNTELQATINFPTEHFSMESDNLLQAVYKLGAESRTLEEVPISLSFVNKNISAIIGTADIKTSFIKGLLLQMMAYHSYEDLKIVIMTTEKNDSNWDALKVLPHCWTDNHTARFYATNLDDAKEISLLLEQDLQARKYKDVNGNMELNNIDYKKYKPYYVIITDDYKAYRDLEIIKDVAEMELNVGFSLIVISPRLVNIPNECKTFISIGDQKSGVFENELVSNKQKEFIADADPTIDLYECCKILANIPIDIAKESGALPNSITFLEMYNVGMIEQLNVLNRWKNNDPTQSLQVPVGVDKAHELFKLDLHEKSHGPHGLIAGMTGSGKSEFIISYILSMAVNYHPYEVSFVLIDYKGGGLTGAFENKETGLKLPHLAGTITNLDTVEMNRSLASIQSELRKRQRLFNEARDKLNESTIDIYKYQSLYRKGKVDMPISHLFIISDEFAELKDQRPEFMEQLISTARIGRSLGVHLILATQKPAGVVNDQIWSNSKFRVCLKVQDKSDSMDMIKCPDAANLKNVGRFYLQVGYNELFAQGQAAWAGAQYYPTEKRKKKVDQTINFLDITGNIIKSLDSHDNDVKIESKGEEITNIVNYLVTTAKEENIEIDQLWLNRIPDVIYTRDIKKKYNIKAKKNLLQPIIGEYDDPDNQSQGPLILPLSEDGNTIVYGSTGSGKDLMLTNIIYSLITTHDSKEVNIYALDFGAETLTMFKKAPHVGDVLLSNDKEKIANLFKLLTQIIEDRKKLFVDYNGSFDFYINHGGKQIPMIVIVINNIEAFLELYSEYEDLIGQITRDCLKYGVTFIVSTNGSNTIRYRLKQNFKQNLVLQFNDPSDYGAVIPGVRKKVPSKAYGRGLVLTTGIYEFQTSYPYKEEKLTEYIKVICNKLCEKCEFKAKKIPILPETVTINDVIEKFNGFDSIPIGIEKESLEISTIQLKNPIFTITGEDLTGIQSLIAGIMNMISTIPSTNCYIMDTSSLFNNSFKEPIKYSSGECKELLEEIVTLPEKVDGNHVVVITGINKYLLKLDPTIKAKLVKALTNMTQKSNIKIFIIDTIDGIKSISYEAWFKENVDLSDGMWIGNNISGQFTIKVTTNARLLRAEIEAGFGYCILKGKATLVKFLSDE